MSIKLSNEQNQESFIDEESSIGDVESTFNHGRWTEEEHRRFLEASAMYGNKWEKVKEHVQTRSSRQIRSHAQKFIIRLSKKNNFISKGFFDKNSLKILDQYKNLSKHELECIIMKKFKGSTFTFFDLEKRMLNNNNCQNQKRIFFISKYPKYRILKDLIEEISDTNCFDFVGNFLGEKEKDSEFKKKLVEGIILDSPINEESNVKKMEELKKMSEVLQILNKTNQKFHFTNSTDIISQNNSGDKVKDVIPKKETNQKEKNYLYSEHHNQKKKKLKYIPSTKESHEKEKKLFDNTTNLSTITPLETFTNLDKKNVVHNHNTQNFFTSVNYNILNNNLLALLSKNNSYDTKYLETIMLELMKHDQGQSKNINTENEAELKNYICQTQNHLMSQLQSQLKSMQNSNNNYLNNIFNPNIPYFFNPIYFPFLQNPNPTLTYPYPFFSPHQFYPYYPQMDNSANPLQFQNLNMKNNINNNYSN